MLLFVKGLAGAAFLLAIGVKTLLARPADLSATEQPLGLASGASYGAAGLIVLGVFLGSAGWWILLAGAAARLRGRIGPRFVRVINLVSGSTILGFAGWQLATLFR